MPRIEKSAFDELVEELFKTSLKSKEEKEQEKQKAMQDLAKTNKELFDAHIKAGFTPEQAIQIVLAVNGR
nr:MAG: hypothetical protein [Bacteriophage sp.]